MLKLVYIVAFACLQLSSAGITIYSDSNTDVVGPDMPIQAPAVPLSFIHSAWGSMPGAQWIWDAPSVTNPALDQSSTFSRGFYLYTTPSSATLKVAADNNLQTFVNGLPTTCNCNSCFSSSSQVSCNIASTLKPGWNHVVFTVINLGVSGSDYTSNPGGLLYSLVIT